jgi:2,3-dihydro-2,3-dihydroxybenzoate dehydrogenase
MPQTGIEGRVAMVTGAAQGIGAAVSRALAERGARVAAVDRNATALAAAMRDLHSAGLDVRAFPVDVTDSVEVERAVEAVEAELGPIAILANVAGVLRLGPLVEVTDEAWSAVFAVNTSAVFYVSRAVARRMMPRRSGAIVTVSSNAARVPRTRMGVYGASKAATTALTKTLGLELAEHGIRCNVVSPGSTDTPMLRAMWNGPASRSATVDGDPAAYRVGIPLRKLAEAGDIAAAVAFLASDEAGHITMHDLCVDGGAALGG